MESQTQKWVTLSYIAVAALAAWVLSALAFNLSSAWELEARFKQIETIIRVGSVALGFVAYFAMSRNQVSNKFTTEVVEELSRVTWPTVDDTSKATIVVMIMVLISGGILGLFDALWTAILTRVMAGF